MNAPDYWDNLDKLCAHYSAKLNLSFEEAMKMFNEKLSEAIYLFNKTDMAAVMHACIRDRIRKNFYGVTGAYIVDKPGRAFMLILDGVSFGISAVVGIKFKKQRKNLRTANIQTQAVIDFNSQQTEYLQYLPTVQLALPLPEFQNKLANPPKGNNLIAGYTPNLAFTNYERITITFPIENGKFKMLSEITRISSPSVPNVEELHIEEKSKPKRRIQRRRKTGEVSRTKLKKVAVHAEDSDNQIELKSGTR
jgi:hypothetical protein